MKRLLAALVIAITTSMPAYAAFPGANGTIIVNEGAWITDFDTCPTDTSNLGTTRFSTDLTPGSRLAITDSFGYPVGIGPLKWAPSGGRYSFIADRPDEIGVATADNLPVGAPTNASYVWSVYSPTYSTAPVSATWTRDSRTLIFSSAAALFKLPLFTGAGPMFLTWGDFENLKASPDGQYLAFTKPNITSFPNYQDGVDDRSEIGLIKQDGTGLRLYPKAADATFDKTPDWSPDSSKLVFASNRALKGTNQWNQPDQLFTMNADGTGAAQLTHDYSYRYTLPVWSPDGTEILAIKSAFAAPFSNHVVLLDAQTGAELKNYTPPCNVGFNWLDWQALPATDLNHDGRIDIMDFSTLLSHWHQAGSGDLDGNGIVDILDLSRLFSAWSD